MRPHAFAIPEVWRSSQRREVATSESPHSETTRPRPCRGRFVSQPRPLQTHLSAGAGARLSSTESHGDCLVLTNTRFPRTSNSTLLSPVISSRSNGGFTHSAGISTGKVKAAASATSEDGSRWNVANCSLSDSVQPRDPLDKETRQARLKRRIRGSG